MEWSARPPHCKKDIDYKKKKKSREALSKTGAVKGSMGSPGPDEHSVHFAPFSIKKVQKYNQFLVNTIKRQGWGLGEEN